METRSTACSRGRLILTAVLFLVSLTTTVNAQNFVESEDALLDSALDVPDIADADFGPIIELESIEIVGNDTVARSYILAALSIAPGDTIPAGSNILAKARLSVMALGSFRKVELSLTKGSKRGQVELLIEVEERGSLALHKLYFGTSQLTPWWVGIDASDRNFLSTGLELGLAVVGTGAGRALGGRSQQSSEIRLRDGIAWKRPIGWEASFFGVRASEVYRLRGESDDPNPVNFGAFDYSRIGGTGSVSVRLSRLWMVTGGLRFERINSKVPLDLERTSPDPSLQKVDPHLKLGTSLLSSFSLAADRDSLDDPVLPRSGTRLKGMLSGSGLPLGSSYNFVSAFAKYQNYWPLRKRRSAISLHLGGAIVLGDTPQFERLHVGDINRMVPPRAQGLITSTLPSLDLLGTSTDEIVYGEVAASAEVQYSQQLFERKGFIYGGDFYVGMGVWTLVRTADVTPRDSPPVDIMLDAGLRLDTDIGIFELSIANGLGRLPL